MNIKWSFLVVVVMLFCSCKREFNRQVSQGALSLSASGALAESGTGLSAGRIEEKNFEEPITTEEHNIKSRQPFLAKEKQFVVKKISQHPLFGKEPKTEQKVKKGIKKEVDPRLSRGLWMTIFGGIATTLGIVFMGYAPTGLFVFAFGIVFLVGVITLIMYLSNPRPKM